MGNSVKFVFRLGAWGFPCLPGNQGLLRGSGEFQEPLEWQHGDILDERQGIPGTGWRPREGLELGIEMCRLITDTEGNLTYIAKTPSWVHTGEVSCVVRKPSKYITRPLKSAQMPALSVHLQSHWRPQEEVCDFWAGFPRKGQCIC